MKITLFLLVCLCLASSSFCEDDYSPEFTKRAIWDDLPFKLPGWITQWFPDFGNILLMTKNALVGSPAKVVASSIDTICTIAKFTGFLSPSYVPPTEKLSLALYSSNDISIYPLRNAPGLINDKNFDLKKNVTVFLSDWESIGSSPNNIVNLLARSYSQRDTHNFIVVNVADFVDTIYRWAVLDTRKTGEIIGDAIAKLVQTIPGEHIHFVGHGLGAHIAGSIGRYVHRVTGQQIGRITGLDPSRICHDQSNGYNSLEPGQAAFVDVIHSNSGVLGVSEPIGDADFYPNGPIPLPPGCIDVVCAHNLAVRYYGESVNVNTQNTLMAVRCKSFKDFKKNKCVYPTIPMGFNTPSSARGSYFLFTNSDPPYGKETPSYE